MGPETPSWYFIEPHKATIKVSIEIPFHSRAYILLQAQIAFGRIQFLIVVDLQSPFYCEPPAGGTLSS